ncbi:MAG: deoxyribose-phosphate aldolase [Spirochaetales bacterium]|nr:deoxyribose-phosphate aldolase [Spirochaetales bacterium]
MSDIKLKPEEMAKYIDHTLLKAEAKGEDIDKLCMEARDNGFCSVCVNTCWASRAVRNLSGTDVITCVVVGFPLGAMDSRAKAAEAGFAVGDGAGEVDMVLNIGALKSGDLELVESDIRAVLGACDGKAKLKVIIETALLTKEEIILASQIVKKAGAHFVKTSTGFSTSGAKVEDVALMRKTVGPDMGVKAAGGVRTFEDAVAMINAGATRLGTSGGIKIINGQEIESGY